MRASRSSEAYVPPSSRTACTELTALERYSEVVPDVLLSQTLQVSKRNSGLCPLMLAAGGVGSA